MSEPVLEGQDEQVLGPQPPSGAPAPRGLLAREWPIIVVLVAGALSLVVVAAGHFRRGSVLLAATVVLATFLRLLLRDDEAGLLAVRSKTVDVVTLAVLGIALAVLSFAVPPPS